MAGVNEIVLGRLKLLDEYTGKLRELSLCTFEEYQANYLISKTTERLLHLAIETCLDIGNRILAEAGFRAPEDNKDVFNVLAEEGIVPQELLPRLVDMAAFRNLLVHSYTKINDAIVHGILRDRLGDLNEYTKAITDYLAGQ